VQIGLLIGGAFLQFFGIMAIAWPDVTPWLRRPAAWLARWFRRIGNRVRKWLGLPPRTGVIAADLAGSVDLAGSASLVGFVEEGATLEHKAEFLLRRATEAQVTINDHAPTVF
jgi:hypothetical protein